MLKRTVLSGVCWLVVWPCDCRKDVIVPEVCIAV